MPATLSIFVVTETGHNGVSKTLEGICPSQCWGKTATCSQLSGTGPQPHMQASEPEAWVRGLCNHRPLQQSKARGGVSMSQPQEPTSVPQNPFCLRKLLCQPP